MDSEYSNNPNQDETLQETENSPEAEDTAEAPVEPGTLPVEASPPPAELKQSELQAGRNMLRNIVQWFKDLLLAASVCLLIIAFVIQPFRVEKTSMEPLLHDSDRILVSKISLWFEPIRRGDIVVLMNPRDPDESWIKRVIGLPGELIQLYEGVFYVNGVALEEDYIPEIERTSKNMFPPLELLRFIDGFHHSSAEDNFQAMGYQFLEDWETDAGINVAMRIPEGYYFVAGDHRRFSMDSRDSIHIAGSNGPGLIPERYIYGKAVFRYWPMNKMGMIPHPVYETEEED